MVDLRLIPLRCLVTFTLGCSAALGCSATTDRPPADAGNGGSGQDGGPQDAGDRPKPTPVPTTFTLANIGSAPLVVGGQCGGTFLSLMHEGDSLLFDRSCACSCDAPEVCGCPPICLNTQELVVPGESTSVEWDGLFARFDEPACYELAGLTRGDVVTADGCWSLGLDEGAVACESVDFAYDIEREVTIEARHDSAVRTPVTVVLENQTGGPIELVTDECGVQTWFALELRDQPETTLSAFCPCACNADFELDSGSCPVCGGCAETVTSIVAAGATHSFEWDGRFFWSYQSGCMNQYSMPRGLMVAAEVCFTRSGATSRTCQPFSFVLGESDEVRATVM